MGDRILFSFFVLPIIAWGVLSIIKPELALKFTLGNLFKNIEPNQFFIKQMKVSGMLSIIVGTVLLYVIFTGGFG
ncbi:hypothetical protein [Paenibacillus mucilaginosus]|uniref:hypothetical protein n=1 Tax=Paenibacillus mucilaginosus TaxID=61624 RepID=UPI003D1F1714